MEPELEYIFLDGERLARYRLSDLGGSLETGMNLGNRSQLRVGYLYTRRDVEVNTGSPLMPEVERDDAGLTASFTFDNRDTPFNATRGGAAALEYFRSEDSLGADKDWERVELGVGLAVPVRNDVIWMTLAGGSNLNSDLPADRTFRIGGPGSFPGFELGEIRSDEYWLASGSYLWKIKDIMSIRGQALYAGLRLQAGQTYERLDLIDEDTMYGASVYVTGRTMVGPLTVGVGATSTESYSLWLAIGRPDRARHDPRARHLPVSRPTQASAPGVALPAGHAVHLRVDAAVAAARRQLARACPAACPRAEHGAGHALGQSPVAAHRAARDRALAAVAGRLAAGPRAAAAGSPRRWLDPRKSSSLVPICAVLAAGMLRFVFRERRLTADGIFATVAAYLLIALLFAQVYLLLLAWNPAASPLPVAQRIGRHTCCRTT